MREQVGRGGHGLRGTQAGCGPQYLGGIISLQKAACNWQEESLLLGEKGQEGLFPEQWEKKGNLSVFLGSDAQLWSEGSGSL